MNTYSMDYPVGGPNYRLHDALAVSAGAPLLPARWLLAALIVSGLVVGAMMVRAGLVVAPMTFGFAAALAIMVALAVGRYRWRTPVSSSEVQLRAFCEDFLLFLAISLLGVLASYPAAAATSGFSDAALAHIDRLLHFDWVAWYRVVSDYPVLQHLGVAAYSAIYVSPVLILGYFSMTHRRPEARRFLGTFWLAVVFTLVLFPLFPAEGPLAFLWHGPIPYMPTSALYQEELIPVLRAGQMTHIDLGDLRGLVCAPSFHTASAVVFIAAAWPIRRLRWVIVPINVAMLLATPVEGTHYLTDMIAGALVAGAAILAVRLTLGRFAPSPRFRSAI